LSECVAYQCYAVQEPCEVADRAQKQKAKITTDLKKFCVRQELAALFAGIKLKRWILVVPIHDSAQVNLHLSTKTAQVRTAGLPYVADDFEVLIHDLECFDADSRQARALQRRLISLPPQSATPDEIESWAQGSNPSVRQVAPQLHEALVGVISRHATRLSFIGSPEHATAQEILKSEVDTLVAEFKQSVPNFSDDSAQQLALGTIVEWLMRCPLDFPPYGHAV
jgi:hypothetical protein